ncbi:hypothetical protein [Haloarchaeobius sp. HRN-SO-5]|uniref:hypothetical protein n=1 Tax=Haloarchaeobius sp. HRN-SO-5 TaxID=3446118 RepID=UPI003EBF831D
MEQHDDSGDETVEIAVPAALVDRIERIFTDRRGHEPRSTQESLSVLCDLAAAHVASSADGTATGDLATSSDGGQVAVGTADDGVDGDLDERIDDAFPAQWDADPTVRRHLTSVADRYLRNPNGFSGLDEREADAIASVARQDGLSPDDLREELVSTLYGSAGLPDDLASEFFGEALASLAGDEHDEVTRRAENDDATDDEHDGTTLLRSDLSSDSGHGDVDDDSFDVDRLIGQVSTPTAECDRCGTTRPLDDLETIVGSGAETLELLCSDCRTRK